MKTRSCYFSTIRSGTHDPELLLETVVIGERSKPSVGRWMEKIVLPCMPIFGCLNVYLYNIYIYVSADLESTWKILRTRHERKYSRQ